MTAQRDGSRSAGENLDIVFRNLNFQNLVALMQVCQVDHLLAPASFP